MISAQKRSLLRTPVTSNIRNVYNFFKFEQNMYWLRELDLNWQIKCVYAFRIWWQAICVTACIFLKVCIIQILYDTLHTVIWLLANSRFYIFFSHRLFCKTSNLMENVCARKLAIKSANMNTNVRAFQVKMQNAKIITCNDVKCT